jgi:hypothetical protein
MRTDPSLAAMCRHYELGLEQERLTQGHGRLEFERTKEIICRHLPPPPAVIADIGGGPGRYALWLVDLGYEIQHRDLMQLHVDQVRQASGGNPRIRSEVCDARRLDARRVVLATCRALERVPELLGIGPHLVATAR